VARSTAGAWPPKGFRVVALALIASLLLACNPRTPQAVSNQALALDPRRPGNINLFTSIFNPGGVEGLYPTGSAMSPATGSALSEAQVREQLRTFLGAWYGGNTTKSNQALALFDASHVKTMAPDADIRAALVSLSGTIWAPLLDHFLTSGRFHPARYGGLPVTAFARAYVSGEKLNIIFNSRHNREHFSRRIGAWTHEIGHDEADLARDEERVLHAVTAMGWGQVLIRNPEFASQNTELTRFMNSYLLQFLNSRENDSPQSEIVAPSGVGTAPGSPYNAPDFASIITFPAQTYDTRAPAAVLQVLSGLGVTGSQYGAALSGAFSNLNDNWLSDQQRLQLSVLLQMVTVAEIANRAGMSQQAVIDLLQLQPFLDAIP
jgi:hypothetical protein